MLASGELDLENRRARLNEVEECVVLVYRLPFLPDLMGIPSALGPLPPFPFGAAVTGLVVSTVVGAIAGAVPAIIAVRSRVIDAIRF